MTRAHTQIRLLMPLLKFSDNEERDFQRCKALLSQFRRKVNGLQRYAKLAVTSMLATVLLLQVYAAPQLPCSDLSWNNVMVNGKKTAVYCMLKDRRGMMWLGTNSGLFFFDGISSHSIGSKILSGSHVYAMVEKGDRLFLGSSKGLYVYSYQSGQVTKYPAATPCEIRSLLVVDDNLWMGSLSGMYRLGLNGGAVSNLSRGLAHKSVYSILRDSRGVMYAGTYNGLCRWNPRLKLFSAVRVRAEKPNKGSFFINCMHESDDGKYIYIGGENGLYKFNPVDETLVKMAHVESNNVKCLAGGAGGHLLAGTEDGVFDIFGKSFRHYRHDSRRGWSLQDNEIWCIYPDTDDNVWVGHERGLSVVSNSSTIRTVKLSTLTHSGEGNDIYAIHKDRKGCLWLAGSNGVIRLREGFRPEWYRHTNSPGSISHNRVRSMLEDRQNRIWLATDAGINRFAPGAGGFVSFHVTDSCSKHNTNWVYRMVEDGDSVWVGSFLGGIHLIGKSKLNGVGGTVVSDFSLNAESKLPGGNTVPNNFVNDMLRDKKGNLWVLLFQSNSLFRFNLPGKSLKRFDIYALAKEAPTHICMDRHGRVWCSFRGGVIVFNENGTYRIIRFPYTSSDEGVLAMGNVGNDVWISTQSNVWRVHGDSFVTEILPIPRKPYTAIYDDVSSDKVYLGGSDEITEISKSGINSLQIANPVKLIVEIPDTGDLNLSNNLKGSAQELDIPYGGSVSLLVSTLNCSPETAQRYMYKLAASPADTLGGWVFLPEGSNRISLNGSSMGSYSLLIKPVGGSALPVVVPVKVKAPWFISWWAICLYAITIAVVMSLILWYTHRRHVRMAQEQERQVALANAEKKLDFLTTISHDLKTPLSMILGPASIMKEKVNEAESKKWLETIYNNAVRLNNMLHKALELQQMKDADENLLILSTLDVVGLCKNVFETFKENNPLKKFVFFAQSPQLFIEADAVKMESVVTNLLSNACKYSPRDGATVSLGISSREEVVEIVISDDGAGIASADQPLVFQKMFRASSTSKLSEGTGLGLYLIKRYLDLMNGSICMYSTEGEGTAFVVTLPMSKNNLHETNPQAGTDASGKAKVLIVEDNIQISSFITVLLKDEYTCLASENGRTGLSLATSFGPELVIVDEMMPVMSGLEMVKRMKQHPLLSQIPVIMLTAKSDAKTENDSIKVGIDVFMTKPFEPEVLLGRVRHLVKSRSEMKEKIKMQAIAEAASKPIEAETADEKLLAKISKIIEENISDPGLNVSMLCEKSGIPNKQLYRLVKKYFGMAPLDYIRDVRLRKAVTLIGQNRFTVAEISYMVGFKTPSYFTKCFLNHFGVKPSQYQPEE